MGEAVASVQRRVKVELDLPIGDRYSEFIADLILQRNVRQLEAPHTGKNGCGHYIWRQFASPNKGETATLRCNIR